MHAATHRPSTPIDHPGPEPVATEASPAWRVLPVVNGLGPHAKAWDQLAKDLNAPEATRAAAVDAMIAANGEKSMRVAVLPGEGEEAQAMLVLHPIGLEAWAALTASGAPYSAALIPDACRLPPLLDALAPDVASLRVPLLAPGLLRGSLPPSTVRTSVVRVDALPASESTTVAQDARRACVMELSVVRRGPSWCVHGEPMPRKTATAAATAVSVYGYLDGLPDDVRALFDKSERWHGVQAGLAWLQRLDVEVLRAEGSCAVFVLRVEGRPVAALPLYRSTSRPSVVQPIRNYYTALFAPPVDASVDVARLGLLIDAVHRHWPSTREWRLDPMDPFGLEFRMLRAALDGRGYWTFGFFRFGNWFLPSQGLDWAAYLRRRKSSLRSTISRMSKRLAAANGQTELICGTHRLDIGLDAYERVYARSWKNDEPYPGFVRALAIQSAMEGKLRLGIVWVGDTPVAAQIWVVASGRAEIFKVAYDEEHKALTPGTLLTARLLEHVLDADRVSVVDYLSGDDAYKRVWMEARRERWGLVAHRMRTPRGCLAGLREALAAYVRNRRRRSTA